jgi:hypothetical protein
MPMATAITAITKRRMLLPRRYDTSRSSWVWGTVARRRLFRRYLFERCPRGQ